LYEPAGQIEIHIEAEAKEKVPVEHEIQDVKPAVSVYFPAVHKVQTVPAEL
jgi:hypothetical protein